MPLTSAHAVAAQLCFSGVGAGGVEEFSSVSVVKLLMPFAFLMPL